MWLIPFALGAGTTWLVLGGAQGVVEDVDRRMDKKIEDLKNELIPVVRSEGEQLIRAEIKEAKENFLPFVNELISSMKPNLPNFPSISFGADGYEGFDFRNILARLPGVEEALAMYFAMVDPKTPLAVKGRIASALIYVLYPHDFLPDDMEGGVIDDAAVILYAFSEVSKYVNAKHRQKAAQWLRSEGVTTDQAFRDNVLEHPLEDWADQFQRGKDGSWKLMLSGGLPLIPEARFGSAPSYQMLVFAGPQRYSDPDEPMDDPLDYATYEVAFYKVNTDGSSSMVKHEQIPGMRPFEGADPQGVFAFAPAEQVAEMIASFTGNDLPMAPSATFGADQFADTYIKELYGGEDRQEFVRFITSGHRAPSHALPQYRRMGGRFYG